MKLTEYFVKPCWPTLVDPVQVGEGGTQNGVLGSKCHEPDTLYKRRPVVTHELAFVVFPFTFGKVAVQAT